MKSNNFNLCPTCTHNYDCVLTEQKELVRSCSEFDEVQTAPLPPTQKIKKKTKSIVEMAMA